MRTRSESSDAGVLACAATIAARPADRHRVILIGGSTARRRATAMGVIVAGSISPPLGIARAAARNALAAVTAVGEPDVLCGWSAGCAAILEESDGFGGIRIAIDPASGGALILSGRRATATPTEPPPPAAWFSKHPAAAAEIAEPSPRIALVGNAPGDVDVGLLIGVISLLRVAGVRGAVGIADPLSPGWRRAGRIEAEMLGAGCFVAAEAPPAAMGNGASYVVIGNGGPYARAMLAAAAASRGLIPVAGGDGLIDSVLPPELVAPSSDAPALARLLLELIEDAGRRTTATERLRTNLAQQAGGVSAWFGAALGESKGAAAAEMQSR